MTLFGAHRSQYYTLPILLPSKCNCVIHAFDPATLYDNLPHTRFLGGMDELKGLSEGEGGEVGETLGRYASPPPSLSEGEGKI